MRVCYTNYTVFISRVSSIEDIIYILFVDSLSDHTENYTTESCENTSGISDAGSSYSAYRKLGGKRSRRDFINILRSRRSYLFNKLVQLMPSYMVQPERNLSDFVTM